MFPPTHPDRLRRREFIGLGAASVAGAWLAACGRDAVSPLVAPLAGKATTTRYPLRIPSTTSPSGLTLGAASGSVDVGGGSSSALLYNGQFPGPTIVARRGDRATIEFQNGLSQESITHWHGMIVDHEDDGHPLQAVPTFGTYSYDFEIDQRACLNWYHPHPHMHTGEQVYFGLAGAFIVRDAEEDALPLPSGAYEVPLVIRDASFDSAGNLKFGSKSSGFWGSEAMVNGTRRPWLGVDRSWYRFRVLNGCNARVFRLALGNGASFTLIGNDGGLLASATTLAEITMAPAERVDVLVDFRNLATNASVMLRCVDAGWDIIEFRGTGRAGATGSTTSIPSGALSSITPLTGPSAATRTFSFDGMTRINGQLYDIDRIDFEVPAQTTERWRFRTNGNAPHPVHIHGASFQVVSRTGGRGKLFPWEGGWKDTVLLADFETVDVLIRFERPGEYLIHCHQLAHEDAGMMSNFLVV